MVVPDTQGTHRRWIELTFLGELVLLSHFFEVRVLDGLARRHAVRLVVRQQFRYDFGRFGRYVRWHQFLNAGALLRLKIKLHVRCHFLKLGKQFFRRRTQHIVDLVDLVHLIIAGKERKQGQNLKKDATNAPVVHLVIVVAVGHQAFRWAVPPRANVLCEGWLRVHPTTRPEISKLHLIILY